MIVFLPSNKIFNLFFCTSIILKIIFANGPFKNSDCRLKDLKELKKFGIDKNSFLKLTKPLTGLE